MRRRRGRSTRTGSYRVDPGPTLRYSTWLRRGQALQLRDERTRLVPMPRSYAPLSLVPNHRAVLFCLLRPIRDRLPAGIYSGIRPRRTAPCIRLRLSASMMPLPGLIIARSRLRGRFHGRLIR
jgi:hypothetical protein